MYIRKKKSRQDALRLPFGGFNACNAGKTAWCTRTLGGSRKGRQRRVAGNPPAERSVKVALSYFNRGTFAL